MHCAEEAMNTMTLVAVAGLAAATAIPAFADNIEALKPGEAIAIMPDGHMARAMITDPKKNWMSSKNVQTASLGAIYVDGRGRWQRLCDKHRPPQSYGDL
jgi:hypothetical protein